MTHNLKQHMKSINNLFSPRMILLRSYLNNLSCLKETVNLKKV